MAAGDHDAGDARAATARRRRGSSTRAATPGATAPPRSCAASASPTPTSTAASTTFSGGELTRASLARALAGDPDLLLLDEPTNHLDVEPRGGSSSELQTIDAAVILVAHDRWFLEAVTTAVLELEGGRSTFFPGKWHVWRRRRRRAARTRRSRPSAQAEDIARLERFVARFRDKNEGEAGAGEAEADRADRGGARRGAGAAARRTLGFEFLSPRGAAGSCSRPRASTCRAATSSCSTTPSSCSSAASTSR